MFLPTATMANQIALPILVRARQRADRRADAHIMISELGGAGRSLGHPDARRHGHAGPVHARAGGRRVPRTRPDVHSPPTRSRVENTHNTAAAGCGRSSSSTRSWRPRRELGLAVHLDGARLAERRDRERCPGGRDRPRLRHGHALPLEGARLPARRDHRRLARADGARPARASTTSAARCARPASSPRPALYALDHNVERLADDHERARRLAEGSPRRACRSTWSEIETNFVQIDVGSDRAAGDRRARRSAACALSGTVHPGRRSCRHASRRRRRRHRHARSPRFPPRLETLAAA